MATNLHAQIVSLFFLGELNELSRRVNRTVAETQQENGWHAAMTAKSFLGSSAWLKDDNVELARVHAADIEQMLDRGFDRLHYCELIGSAHIDLYCGAASQAYERLEHSWKQAVPRIGMVDPTYRVLLHHLRARAALGCLSRESDDRKLHRVARRDGKGLCRDWQQWARPLGQLVLAGLAAVEGNQRQSIKLLRVGIQQCDEAELALFAAAARCRLGALLNNNEGQSLLTAGTNFMQQQGIRSPERMIEMLIPGFD